MTNELTESAAALLALGVLTGAERDEAVTRAEVDPVVAAEVEGWERMLAPLALSLAPTPAPDGLFALIEARIDAVGPVRTIRADGGDWIEVAPGLRVRILSVNRETRRQTILLDVLPGAIYEGHDHRQDEEIFMISGDLSFGGVSLAAGDYHFAPKGSVHPRATTRAGCRCLVIQAL